MGIGAVVLVALYRESRSRSRPGNDDRARPRFLLRYGFRRSGDVAMWRFDLEKAWGGRLIQSIIIYLLLFFYFSGCFPSAIIGDSRILLLYTALHSTGPRSASPWETRTD